MRRKHTFTPADMDVMGRLFGMTIDARNKTRDGTESPLITIFVEDDEVMHEKVVIDAAWLDDLIRVAELAKAKLKKGSRDWKGARA